MPTGQNASFRDPDGFLFEREGTLYRQVNDSYQHTFEKLESSGLYRELIDRQLLVDHQRVPEAPPEPGGYCVIQPERLPVISYPYEWSFSQLKDAALLTLEIQRLCLDAGFSLKDASAYNVQFYEGRPLFIDTLSFETLREDRPWVAYRQFCQHFLAPLALMSFRDIALQQLLKTNIDGVPLGLASKLLPKRTWLRFSLLIHIHLHARSQSRHAGDASPGTRGKFSLHAFRALIDNLSSAIRALSWQPTGTEWGDYYDANNNYTGDSLSRKADLVGELVAAAQPRSVWDLGANTGRFSAVAAEVADTVCAWDIDPACVEQHYLAIRAAGEKRVYPLLLDLANPSPAIGWANLERASFSDRAGVDLVLALGLIHHLVIGNNLPLERVADYFSRIGSFLLIELVPRSDSQVQKLLASREEICHEYGEEEFERAFSKFFVIDRKASIPDTERTLYLMKRRDDAG